VTGILPFTQATYDPERDATDATPPPICRGKTHFFETPIK
jgi:hypothetical protein